MTMDKFKPERCFTVGDLQDALAKLPRDMDCKISFEDSIDVVVYNQGEHDEHVSFEDGGMWTDDDDDLDDEEND